MERLLWSALMSSATGWSAAQCYNHREMNVCATVEQFVHRHGLLPEDARIVVGVSGGADSLCLFDCLHSCGYSLILAHLDHQLRPDSQQDAEFAQKVAERYAVPSVVDRADVRSRMEGSGSLEETARLVRYRFLARVAKQHGTPFVATGHTADDQVETIVMHFLRGAGSAGLRGMLPSTSLDDWTGIPEGEGIMLVRPILDLTREQTEAHCRSIGLQPRMDSSNLDLTFFRNRLRHELLPELATYNPGVKDVILRTGRVMAGLTDLVETLVAEEWSRVVGERGEGTLGFGVAAMRSLPIALQRGLIRKAIARLKPGLRDVDFDSVERAVEFAKSPTPGHTVTLLGGLRMIQIGDEVVLCEEASELRFPEYPQVRSMKTEPLEIDGDVSLAEGWSLSATSKSLSSNEWESLAGEGRPRQIALDARELPSGLTVRAPKPGDRFQPLGMPGSVKVADLFINLHIPKPARDRWPLIVAGDRIVWVVGLRMSHLVRLTKSTREAVVLRLRRLED